MTRPVRASLALLALLTVSTAQAQGPGLERVMHKKLEVSQQILEGKPAGEPTATVSTSKGKVSNINLVRNTRIAGACGKSFGSFSPWP